MFIVLCYQTVTFVLVTGVKICTNFVILEYGIYNVWTFVM